VEKKFISLTMGKNLKSYLKIFRITEWRAYFLMAFLGFLVAKGFLFPLMDIFIFFVLIISFLAFGFAVNNCFDTKEDKNRNDKINPLAEKEIKFKNTFILSILPGFLGLTLSLIFGWKVFLFCLAGLTVSFFYSAPPLRFKGRPVLDLISHGFFAGVFWFALPLLVFKSEWNLFHYFLSLSIFYLSLTLELRNHLEDFDSDKEADLKTFVCVFGKNFSERLLQLLALLFPLTIFPVFLLDFPKHLFLFFVSILIFLFFFQFLQKSKTKEDYKSYRALDFYSIFLFSFLVVLNVF